RPGGAAAGGGRAVRPRFARGRRAAGTATAILPFVAKASVGRRCVLAGVAIAFLCGAGLPVASAHTVKTKDGKTYEGQIVANDDKGVVIEAAFDGRKALLGSDVASAATGSA